MEARSAATSRALILVATYNELDNLPRLLENIFAAVDADVLIIDDSSPDGTGELADRLAASEPRLHVVHRPAKQGVASAHAYAFRHALERGYAHVVEMDADFSHPPEDLPRLLAACAHADVAVGSRNVPGGRVVGRSRFRNALTRAGCAYARTVLRLPVRDCTGGYRCTRRSALEVIDVDGIASEGYGFQLELNLAWKRAGMRFVEIPIVFPDRVVGVSKMSSRILVEALLVVLRLRFNLLRAPLLAPAEPARAVRASRL